MSFKGIFFENEYALYRAIDLVSFFIANHSSFCS